jgi:hypothetical protein
MSVHAPRLFLIAGAAILALAGCGAPPEARRDLPDTQSGEAPDLLPTASFDSPRTRAAEREVELGEAAAELAARAERLRASGEALAAPVLTPEERARLEASP